MDTVQTDTNRSGMHDRRSARRRPGQPLRVARDLLTVRRAFGEPIERDGATLVPVARVIGGAGKCQCEGYCPKPGKGKGDGMGSGSGGGFGVRVSPMGVFVVRGSDVTWQPAFDLNRVAIGGQVVGAIALIMLAKALRRRRRR
jgi:uncharacterized spore protein YtfJ